MTPVAPPSISNSSTSVPTAIAGAIGGVALVTAIVVGMWFLLRKKSNDPSLPLGLQPSYRQQSPPLQSLAPISEPFHRRAESATLYSEKTPAVKLASAKPYFVKLHEDTRSANLAPACTEAYERFTPRV